MENTKLHRRTDLTGKVFGRLIVLQAGIKRTPSRGMYWLCKCDCGTIKEITAQALTKEMTVSCGCYNKEIISKCIHGHNKRNSKKSPTYYSWCKMNDRCNNQNAPEYKWYGAKGIKVCERWKDFRNFLQDMGERPKGMSIDRIEVNGDYEPLNCKWSNAKEQANNTNRSVYITYKGQTKTISEWADFIGIKYDTLYCRLFRYNMSYEDALTSKKYIPIPNTAGFPIKVKPIEKKMFKPKF